MVLVIAVFKHVKFKLKKFDPWFFDLRSGAGAAFAEIKIFHR